MLWLVLLLALILRRALKKFNLKRAWWLPFILYVVAMFALLFAPLPLGWGNLAGLAAKVLNFPLGWVGGLIGANAAIIAAVLLVVLLVLGIVDLWKDKKPDGWARTMAITVPILALVASGPIAKQVRDTVDTVNDKSPAVVEQISSGT